MNKPDPIAEGRTAEIIPLSGDRVLKLYRPGFPKEAAERERRASIWAVSQGLAVPTPGEVVEVDGRWGLEFPRIDGENGMARIMADVSRADGEAFELARLQVAVNACEGGSLPDRRALLEERIESVEELTAIEKRFLGGILGSLPEGDRLLHGDMHPGNVIWSPSGPVLIDWVDASRGLPVADVARSLVLFGAYRLRPETPDPRSEFANRYSDAYRELSGDRLHRLGDWVLVTAAARIAEGAANGDSRVRSYVHRSLSVVSRAPGTD